MNILILSSLIFVVTNCEESAKQLAKANNNFSQNFYKIISEKEENVIFSPFSAHAVLSMAYQGAANTTAQAFANTLQIANAEAAAEGYKIILDKLKNDDKFTLNIANKIYVKEGLKIAEKFNKSITDNFQSEIESIDFGKTETAKSINSWVEQKTNTTIVNLFKSEELDALTRLILVNAVYFKNSWAYPFNKELTTKETFYVNEKDSIQVDMMHIKNNYTYKEDKELDAKVISIPYIDRRTSMVVILPNDKNGIKALESKLTNMSISDIIRGAYRTDVDLAMPKFKIEATIDLKDILTRLGLEVIFNDKEANFTGILENSNETLSVSAAIQKAFIEVNEEGAEAAASTGLVIQSRSYQIYRSATMKVDHPFVFFISKWASGRIVLFYGRCNKPMV